MTNEAKSGWTIETVLRKDGQIVFANEQEVQQDVKKMSFDVKGTELESDKRWERPTMNEYKADAIIKHETKENLGIEVQSTIRLTDYKVLVAARNKPKAKAQVKDALSF